MECSLDRDPWAASRLKWMIMTDVLDLFHQLIRFETELWNGVDARLRTEFNLPLSRLEPMQVIARHPSCRVYDIAAELSITIGGTSKLVDRIQAAGYCVRHANPVDRRSSIQSVNTLARSPLFAQLSDSDLARFNARCQWRRLHAGELFSTNRPTAMLCPSSQMADSAPCGLSTDER